MNNNNNNNSDNSDNSDNANLKIMIDMMKCQFWKKYANSKFFLQNTKCFQLCTTKNEELYSVLYEVIPNFETIDTKWVLNFQGIFKIYKLLNNDGTFMGMILEFMNKKGVYYVFDNDGDFWDCAYR